MDRKIYFAGSIRGGRNDVDTYFKIIEELKEKYGTVMTEFVGDKKITADIGTSDETKSDKQIHDTDVAMLKECHYVVAEVTTPSLGVGYEIGRASAMGKSILCLYRPGDRAASAMITGAENGTTFVVKTYKELSDAKDIIKDYFSTRQ